MSSRSELRAFLGFVAVLAVAHAAGCSGKANGGAVGAGSDGGPVSGCQLSSGVPCTNGDGFVCDAQTDPASTNGSYACGPPTLDPAGNDEYCCVLVPGDDSTCTPDDTVTSQCPCAESYGYQCYAPADDPTSLDPSLDCSIGFADPDGTSTDFCCTFGPDCGADGGTEIVTEGGTEGSIDGGIAGLDAPLD